jgi:hypothetical protein
MLTDEQLEHRRSFGVVIIPGLFDADELNALHDDFYAAARRAEKLTPFDGSKRHWIVAMGDDTPFISSLLEDPRFRGAAAQMFGDDVIGLSSAVSRYVGSTYWHPDTCNIKQYGVKFAYYLQPVRADSGALRVLPGSHRNPWHDEIRELRARDVLGEIEKVPAFVCEADPGDVVAFDLRAWHASWGGSDDRSLCDVVYYANPSTDEELEATRWQLDDLDQDYPDTPWNESGVIPAAWRVSASTHPKRKEWLDRIDRIRTAEPTGLRYELHELPTRGADGRLVPESSP